MPPSRLGSQLKIRPLSAVLARCAVLAGLFAVCLGGRAEAGDSSTITLTESEAMRDTALARRVLDMLDAHPKLRRANGDTWSAFADQLLWIERPLGRALPTATPMGFSYTTLTFRGRTTAVAAQLCAFPTLQVEFEPAEPVKIFVLDQTRMTPASASLESRYALRPTSKRHTACGELATPSQSIEARDAAVAWTAIQLLRQAKAAAAASRHPPWLHCPQLSLQACRRLVIAVRESELSDVASCSAHVIIPPAETPPVAGEGEACIYVHGLEQARERGPTGWSGYVIYKLGPKPKLRAVHFARWWPLQV